MAPLRLLSAMLPLFRALWAAPEQEVKLFDDVYREARMRVNTVAFDYDSLDTAMPSDPSTFRYLTNATQSPWATISTIT